LKLIKLITPIGMLIIVALLAIYAAYAFSPNISTDPGSMFH